MALGWDATFEIARELRRMHPEADLPTVSLAQIHAWTISLDEFDDDPHAATDDILLSIYQDWYEESLNDG